MKAPRAPRSHITVTNRQRAVRIDAARLRRLVRFVARREGARVGTLDVAVVGADEIAGLNRRFLGQRGPTDVLSFDLAEDPAAGVSGQIVVCGELAASQGRLRGHGPTRELLLYVVHGLLHLMGHDDVAIRSAARMHAREDELLEAFGVGPAYDCGRRGRRQATARLPCQGGPRMPSP